MSETFIGRQAIYDRALRVHAYELLYRSGRGATAATHTDGDLATARVLANAFLDVGAQQLAGNAACFVNLTKPFITGELPLPLPADRVVVEVLEDIEPTPEIVEGIRKLAKQGVRVAMDDYIHRDSNHELLKLCDYVKIDLRAQGKQETEHLVEILKEYDVKLLAEKVETREEFDWCVEVGFHYFQGFFLTKPETVEGRHIPANRVALLRMLSRLLDPDVEVDEIEDMVSQDVSLAYKLLRYANSTMFAPSQPITKIGQTLVMLGLKAVRQIVTLIVLVDIDDKPGDLLPIALVRARMCEALAEQAGIVDPSAYYTVGLLSTLDALTGAPMEELMEHLPLAPELEAALLRAEGDYGQALNAVRAFERTDWSGAGYHDFNPMQLSKCYVKGVKYSEEVFTTLPRGPARMAG